MTIGLHLAAYQCEEFIEKFLEPWMQYRVKGGRFELSVGHVCFKENFEQGLPISSSDKTKLLLEHHYRQQHIDFYKFIDKPMTEVEARNCILSPIKNKIDFLWLAAPDEIYTLEEIERTVKYIQNEEFITTFFIEFKNLVFSEQQYVRGFAPTRIFRNTSQLKISHFCGDDEVVFLDDTGHVSWKHTAQKRIPISICNPLHYTWLNNQRSKDKVHYQEKRWNPPNGYGCSFAWDDAKNCLVWNQDYFKRTGQPIPVLYSV